MVSRSYLNVGLQVPVTGTLEPAGVETGFSNGHSFRALFKGLTPRTARFSQPDPPR